MEQHGHSEPSAAAPRPPRGRHRPGPGHPDLRRDLRDAILSRVVPRLSGAGSAAGGGGLAPRVEAVTDAEVVRFSDLALAAAVPELVRHVEARRADGLSADDAVLRLMAPAARRLGDLWLDDEVSFLDVTAGLGRLQGVLRALGPDFDRPAPAPRAGRRVLLAPVPGEQHVFGLSVVAAFFRRAGWHVTFEPRIAWDGLLALARAESFAAIGLSVAGDRFLPALPAQVEALRRASRDPRATLLAGGPAFLADPDLGRRAGVDAVAADAAEAVRVAESLSGRAPAVPAAA